MSSPSLLWDTVLENVRKRQRVVVLSITKAPFFFRYVISVDVTDRLFLPRNWFIAMFDYRDRKIYKNGLEHNLGADLK